MVFLILESLGSTELLFILAMALVFFGPRKLPQLSRSLGKSMAEFRRASEDFKRTWDREVNEEVQSMTSLEPPTVDGSDNSILAPASTAQPLQPPTIQAVSPDRVIARQTIPGDANSSANDYVEPAANHSQPPRKSDWL